MKPLEQKQAEAKVRQEIYAKLSTEQKLAGLPPYGSRRQRERLEALLAPKPVHIQLREDLAALGAKAVAVAPQKKYMKGQK